MNFIKKLEKRIKEKKTIVFPEGTESRIIKAAKIIERKRIAKIILLKTGNIDERIKEGMNLVKDGKADGLITGASHPSLDTLKNAFKIIGTRNDVKKASGVFLMILKNKIFLFADCAAIPEPNSNDLAEIAKLSKETFEMLTQEKARIAMLSYSTNGSGKGESVDKVRKAVKIAKKEELEVYGETQADAALIYEVCKRKFPGCKDRANVLIFPNLDAGNIGYKLVERLANAKAIGPIIQGLNKPINDLSRGCSVEDIVNLTITTVLQASYKK